MCTGPPVLLSSCPPTCPGQPPLRQEEAEVDWEVPKIPEETTEKLISMFTLRPLLTDAHIIPKVCYGMEGQLHSSLF